MSKKPGKAGGSKNTPETILAESMRCPVCTELLLSPIYQCERGHNICCVCIEEVHECPLCKGDYGDTRNYFAEELVNSMSFPCKYAEYGCTSVLLGSVLKDHQEECQFQPYRCPELACQELVGQGQMAQHLEKHGFRILEGESHMATIDIQDKHFDVKTEYNPWRIRTFGQEFYTVASRQRDKNWYVWSWVLALPKNAKKYSCEIVLSSSTKEVIYRGTVHSLRVPPEDIIKSANALVLTDHMTRSLRENGKITCKVRFIQGKNWERETTKKEKKSFLQKKNEAKKCVKGKGFKAVMPKLPSITRPPSITIAMSAIKKLSKASVASSSTPSTSRVLPVIKGKPGPASSVATTPKKPSVTDAEQSLVLKMRESLKCPGCTESIAPPIFVCTIGHSVCEGCRNKHTSTCPLCRCPIIGTRNFFAEELLYKTVQKCRFHSSGCDVCLPAVQIRMHEECCDFAPYECPFSTCRKVFDPNDLLEHMKTHDLALVHDEINMSIPFPKTTSAPMCAIPSILVKDGIAFYPLVLRESSGVWAFWVASSDATNFVYELRIKKQSKLLAFQGRVMSLRLNPNQILVRGEGLITTEKSIKNFKVQDKFEFSLKIAPIKGFTKSGITFLTPLCAGSKADLTKNSGATKTELFATPETSKDKRRRTDEDEDDDEEDLDNVLLFARMRRRNTYAELFASEDEEDDVVSHVGSSPDSRSSHSVKKGKSGSSVSSIEYDFGKEDDRSYCSEELKSLGILESSQTTVTFTAVEHGPTEQNKHKTTSPKTDSKLKIKLGEDKKTPLVKKKSSLKLKEKTSQQDVSLSNVKESPSAKKVEFSPNAEVFAAKDQDQVNNNWSDKSDSDEEVKMNAIDEVSLSLSDSSLLNNTSESAPQVKQKSSLDQIAPVKSSHSVQVRSKY